MMQRRGFHRPCHGPALPLGGESGGACIDAELRLDEPSLNRLRELDPSGKTGLLARIVATFESSLVRLLPQLLPAAQAADWVKVRRVSHTIKSSAQYLGALPLAAACATVEAMARDEQTAGIEARIGELLAAAEAVRPALRAVPECNP